MTTQALTRTNGLIQQSRDMGFDETRQLAEMCAASGFFQDTRQAAQAMVKILAGRELGFGPIASMNGIYIVKGRVSMSANLIAAAIKASGIYDYRVVQHDEQACEIHFFQRGDKVGESRFTIQEARKAGTQNLDKYARNMLFARALTNGARWHTPDVFNGPVYTPEELGARVNGEGDVIDVEGRTVSAIVQDENVQVDPHTGEIYAPMHEPNRTQVRRHARNSDPEPYRPEPEIDPLTQRPIVPEKRTESTGTLVDAEMCKKGLISHKGWMKKHGLDPDDRDLAIYLLNVLDERGGPNKPYWNSRKDLMGMDWQRVNRAEIGADAERVQRLVATYRESMAEQEQDDPFADEPPPALLDVPVATAGTHHGQS